MRYLVLDILVCWLFPVAGCGEAGTEVTHSLHTLDRTHEGPTACHLGTTDTHDDTQPGVYVRGDSVGDRRGESPLGIANS